MSFWGNGVECDSNDIDGISRMILHGFPVVKSACYLIIQLCVGKIT